MILANETFRDDIVRLTNTAVEAAELGQWDIVDQCYRERGLILETMQAPLEEGSRLLQLDEQIRNRVHTVQAVLGSLLAEAAANRQRLHNLHHRLGRERSVPLAVSMKA
ncbi:MAG: hypothetical protein A4E19_16095 [Nitrospira sp. SG-bin1]|nr:MAG: hypothetical protein A4E19_16095 [Nitrospira sp. SG-bin1]